MAIKRIQEVSSKVLKPYLSEFVKDLSKKDLKTLIGSLHGVSLITKTKSGKGWILESLEFSVFIWSKSKTEFALLEALDDVSYGYPMIEIKDVEGNYNVVFDDEEQYSVSSNGDNSFLLTYLSNKSIVDTDKVSTTDTF